MSEILLLQNTICLVSIEFYLYTKWVISDLLSEEIYHRNVQGVEKMAYLHGCCWSIQEYKY